MSNNPTLGFESQFNAPFDILPNVIYTNVTTGASQFTRPLFYSNNYQTFDYTYPNEPTTYLPYNPTQPNSIVLPGDVSADDIKNQFANAKGRNTFSARSVAWIAKEPEANNITLSSTILKATGLAGSVVAGAVGVPQVSQAIGSILGQTTSNISSYSTLELSQLKPLPGVKYADFRARRILKNTEKNIGKIRLDGASAALRGGSKIFAAASANPFGGAYAIFNREGFAKTGYGWGNHDDIYALRNDFTARSSVATAWRDNEWKPTLNPLERVTPFRGDLVNVIDFKKNTTYQDVYKWKTSILGLDKLGVTQDFIKFFLTGPKLFNGAPGDANDDIIVFRAIITSLSDTFSPQWSPIAMIGRADPNYHYTQITRELSLDFTVYATDRDEMKPIWRKLNALAGYTAPEYDNTSIAFKAPWMRITIGDLFRQQPVIITSLSYTLHDSDTTWEINIEQDPTMKQTPKKVNVSLGLTLISDYLPQKGGRFYTLADEFNPDGQPTPGNHNWLSDAKNNPKNAFVITEPLQNTNTPLPAGNNAATSTTTTPTETNNSDLVLGDQSNLVNLG